MGKKIAVINCGSKKKDQACPAREMYEGGSLFRKMRDYVEQTYDSYYILSGHYGLMEPNQIIEPYEDVVFFVQKIFRDRAKKEGRILKAVSKIDQAKWGGEVANKIDWEQFDDYVKDKSKVNVQCIINVLILIPYFVMNL